MGRAAALRTSLLIFALALVLRLYHLGAQSLWLDEVFSLQQIVRAWSALLLPGGYDEIHPPLYYLTVKPLLPIALGTRDWFEVVLRLSSALFSALGAVAIFWLGSILFDTRTGALAGIFYAVSAFSVWYGQEVRMYSLALLLVMLHVALVLRVTGEKSSWREWLLLFLVSVAAPLTHWYSVFAWPAVVCYVAWDPARRAYLLRLVTSLIAACMVAATHLIPKMLGGRGEMAGLIDWKNFAYLFWSMWVGYSAGPSVVDLHYEPLTALREFVPSLVGFASLALVVGLLTLWIHFKHGFSDRLVLLAGWIAVAMLGPIFLAALTGKTHNARYSFAAFPAIILLIAAAASEARYRYFRVALVSAFLTAQLWSLANYYWDPYYWREDFRTAARVLEETPASRGRALYSDAVKEALAAYGTTNWEWRDYPHYRPWTEELRLAIDEEAPQGEMFWLITGRRWWEDEARIHSYLSDRFELIEHREWVGLDLWVFRTQPAH